MIKYYLRYSFQRHSHQINYCLTILGTVSLFVVIGLTLSHFSTEITTSAARRNLSVQVKSNINIDHVLSSRLRLRTTTKNILLKFAIPFCPLEPHGLHGPLLVTLAQRSTTTTESLNFKYENATSPSNFDAKFLDRWKYLFSRSAAGMILGGHYRPGMCKSRQKVAVVIPYRDREENLLELLHHLLPVLKRQLIEFKIYVIEQNNDGVLFNRGLMKNIGYAEALRDFSNWTCVIFHDVDILPENDRNVYRCESKHPKHLSPAIGKGPHPYMLPYETFFGGVLAFPIQTFRDVNGYSNQYWGWGMEDDDLFKRVALASSSDGPYRIVRSSTAVGRYAALPHKRHTKKDRALRRVEIVAAVSKNMHVDGLTSLKYKLISSSKLPVLTWIKVAVVKNDYVFLNSS